MDEVLALAEIQYGVVARNQALNAGLTAGQVDRFLRSGRFRLVFPGVYAVSGSPRTGRQRALAATLWLGEESAISEFTAATLARFDGCKTTELYVSVLRDVRKRVEADVHVRRVSLHVGDSNAARHRGQTRRRTAGGCVRVGASHGADVAELPGPPGE